jgi:hypothetical protein
MAQDPSEILIVYPGANECGGYLPMGQEQLLRAAFPRDARSARAEMESYLQFPDHLPTERTSNDLAAEQRIDEQRLAQAFPELSAGAVNALACRWFYRRRAAHGDSRSRS